MHRTQPIQGFTTIELAVCLLIIAILTAFGLAQYLSVQKEARATVMSWTASSLRMAVVLVRAQAKLSNAKPGETVEVERRLGEKARIKINQLMNPIATPRGIGNAVEILDPMGQLVIYPEATVGGRLLIYQIKGSPACQVSYREDLMSGLITIRKDTSDCS